MPNVNKILTNSDEIVSGGTIADTATGYIPLDVIMRNGDSRVEIEGDEYFSGATKFRVKVSDNGELAVTSAERERNVAAVINDSSVGSTKYYVAVDLDDTTNFPHAQTGRIDVSYIDINVDKDSNAVGTMLMGVVTAIDSVSSNISYLWWQRFKKSSETLIQKTSDYAPSQLKFGVDTAGALQFGVTSIFETSVTAVNTETALDSPRGATTVNPAKGDVVFKAEFDAGGVWNWDATVLYHGEA